MKRIGTKSGEKKEFWANSRSGTGTKTERYLYRPSEANRYRYRSKRYRYRSAQNAQIVVFLHIYVTPQTRGSVDYPSTPRIQVEVGLPDATLENRAESPLYGELYPNTEPV